MVRHAIEEAEMSFHRLRTCRRTRLCARSANRRHHAPSFEHVVGLDEQGRWHGKPERLCRFEINDHLQLDGKLDRL
jgi:hypothetical protein